MINPWINMDESGPDYYLPSDFEFIQKFNAYHQDNAQFQIRLDSIPEPYIGNPHTAKIVLLLLNPGHSDEDILWQRKADFRHSLFNNLRHQANDYPFYLLDPRFRESGGGQWWRKKLSPLLKIYDEKQLSQHILAIQWFPYHSVKYSRKPLKSLLTSQQYSHWLTQKLIDQGKEIVVMRSLSMWKEVVRFRENPIVLKNPRNPVISIANLGSENFNRLSQILSG